ncbi:MAG: mechanosensitive ion channel [Pirellulaceae bacterium]|nr:mechanosensitive ion channel [Pirellulaceae bacterium]
MYLFAQANSVTDGAAKVTEWSAQLKDSVVGSVSELTTTIAGFLPSLIGALIILVLGYFVSKLLQRVACGLLRQLQFDTASEKAGLSASLDSVGVKLTPSDVVGKLVFWLIMLVTLISAADALGLENVSHTIDSFVNYLPNVIGAALIVVIGLMLSSFVKKLLEGAADRIGIEYAKPVSQLVYGILIVVVGALAIGQLQIETELLNRVIEIVLIAFGAALAISVGFGTRDTARNVVSGVYARESYENGARLIIGDDQGAVDYVGTVNTKVNMADGTALFIPNGQLLEMTVKRQG